MTDRNQPAPATERAAASAAPFRASSGAAAPPESAAASSKPVRVAVLGSRGRMGTRLCALAEADPRFELTCALDRGAPPPDAPFDVLIDFSSPEASALGLELALAAGAALLVGTTGLQREHLERLRGSADRLPVLIAANTSLGVVVLRHLVREAVRLLPGYHIDVVEAHHAAKRDAPSGTALLIAQAIADGGHELALERIHALRGGDIVGEHVVQLAGPGETIRLEHRAVSRDLFALGALRAAAWLAGRAPGLYAMEDVVGIRQS
jgi:4-hydroxy-tetrahydrodipicolinate reductase